MDKSLDSICYKKNFLKEVIVRVDFLSPLLEIDNTLPGSLSDIIIKTFPIPEPRDAVQREIKLSPQGISANEEKFKEWLFHAKDRSKTLTLGRQVLVAKHTAYQTYELVRDEFLPILEHLATLFDDLQPSRIGLRYVNVIGLDEPSPLEWSKYLAPEMLALVDFPDEDDRDALARVFHNLEFAFDSFNLRYRFGMHNPDFPARIRQKSFVLDLDAYVQTVAHVSTVRGTLDECHEVIQRYFEKSITNELRSVLNAT